MNADLSGYAQLLRTTADTAEEISSADFWKEQPGSEASREIERVNNGNESLITEFAVRTAYSAAQMGVHVCVQHARAASEIVGLEISPLSVEVLARAAVDVAASTWWITEEGIGARRRVCRLQLIRMNSAMELRKVMDEIGISNADRKYGETEEDVAAYSERMGIEPFINIARLGRNVGCEKEVRPTYSARAKSLLKFYGGDAAYMMYSGSTHGELWSIWRNFRDEQNPLDETNPGRRLAPNRVALHSAVNVILLSMVSQIDAIGRMFGWSASSPQGEKWVPVRQAIPRSMDWKNLTRKSRGSSRR